MRSQPTHSRPAPAERPLVGVAAAVVVFLLTLVPFWEYRTDDTFIFLRFAANLAGGAGPSFNPHQPVYGFSSPLWMLILAACFKLGIGSLTAAKVLAALAGVATLVGLWRLASASMAAPVAIACTLAWSVNAWMVRWTASAMETALVMALVVWSLVLWEREQAGDRRPWSALPLALVALARPEGAVLVALAVAIGWLTGGAGRRRALSTVAVAGLVMIPWLAYAGATMGHVLPVTGAAKGTVGLAFELDALRDVVRIVGTTSAVEVSLLVLGTLLMLLDRRWWRRSMALGVTWLVALPAFYAASGFDVLSRYALPIVPVCVVLGFRAVEAMERPSHWRWAAVVGGAVAGGVIGVVTAGGQRAALIGAVAGAALGGAVSGPTHAWRHWWVAALVVTCNLAVLRFVVFPHTHAFSRGVVECFEGLGAWFRDHTEPDAVVAIADIGAFGYTSGRQVLDMAGLVSPQLIDLVEAYPIQRIAARLEFADIARPGYLIDRWTAPHRLDGALGGTFEALPVAACAIAGLGVRAPETIYYTAYRLDWQRFDRWREEP